MASAPKVPPIAKDDAPIVLTGPTGWIGTAMLATMADRRGPDWAKSVRLFGSGKRMLQAPDGTMLPMRRLATLAAADLDGALLIHLAYLTKDKLDVLGERKFVDGNLAIDDHVLAALADSRPKGVFVASSGAAKLAQEGRDRHPYGLCKLRQEDRFLALSSKTGIPVLAGRIFNLAGPYINKGHAYAIASFLLQARETGRILIESSTPVFRSYLDVGDLCALVLEAASKGFGRAAPVDLCGAEILEMQDIALAVARHEGLGIEAVQRCTPDFSGPSIYVGNFIDTKLLSMELGHELVPFERQVMKTADWLRSSSADDEVAIK